MFFPYLSTRLGESTRGFRDATLVDSRMSMGRSLFALICRRLLFE
jgi:hypothetical protein